jgi:preprotein translocase subunit SecG
MNWLQTLAVVIHVLLAAGIIGLVLLQRGKGADAGAGFGAGASGTVFGARGSASFLSRTTAVLATLFFLSSLGLSYLFSQRTEPTSVVDRVKERQAPLQLPGLPPAQQMPVIPSTAPATSAPAATVPATTAPVTSAPAAGGAPAQAPAPPGQQ